MLTLVQNRAKRTPDFVILADGKPNFHRSVRVKVKKEKCGFLPCDIFVDKNLDNVFETALDAGHDKRVWFNGECCSRSGRDAQGTHCARVIGPEAAGKDVA